MEEERVTYLHLKPSPVVWMDVWQAAEGRELDF